MVRKSLPSSSGLPEDWNKEMELRLGFLEAQDEAREPKIMVRALKREFPTIAQVSDCFCFSLRTGRADKFRLLEECHICRNTVPMD